MKRERKRRTIRKLTVTIGYAKDPDGSHVSINVKGRVLNEIFQEGEEAWTTLKGAIHALIGEMGPIGDGRNVTIRSWP